MRSSARIANVAGALVTGGAGGARPPRADSAPEDGAARAAWEAMLSSIFVAVVGEPPAGATEVANPLVAPARATEVANPLVALEGALREATCALSEVTCDRVLVADPRRPVAELEVLLALTAWPEAAALLYQDEASGARCALYRVADARARLGRGHVVDDVDGLLEALEVERLDRTALGLGRPQAPSSILRQVC